MGRNLVYRIQHLENNTGIAGKGQTDFTQLSTPHLQVCRETSLQYLVFGEESETHYFYKGLIKRQYLGGQCGHGVWDKVLEAVLFTKLQNKLNMKMVSEFLRTGKNKSKESAEVRLSAWHATDPNSIPSIAWSPLAELEVGPGNCWVWPNNPTHTHSQGGFIICIDRNKAASDLKKNHLKLVLSLIK